jgi:hypothetical protein
VFSDISATPWFSHGYRLKYISLKFVLPYLIFTRYYGGTPLAAAFSKKAGLLFSGKLRPGAFTFYNIHHGGHRAQKMFECQKHPA